MSPLSIFSIFSRLASVYALFAALVLSTLWVSSLTVLSAPSNATELLTDAGTDILNPFLVAQSQSLHAELGISESTYASLQKQKGGQLALPAPFKGSVPSGDIAGQPYAAGVRRLYGRIAEAYYAGGAGAVIGVDVPPELKQVLPDFGLFNPTNLPIAPGGPSAQQLPAFLQPLFSVVLLTPDTFTAAGHQRVLSLLPWFWLATIALGIVAFLANRRQDGQKLRGLAHSVIHTTWPIAGGLAALLIAAHFSAAVAHYAAELGVVSRAFIPVYGGALLAGLLALFVPKLLARRASGPATAPAAVGALVDGPPTSGGPAGSAPDASSDGSSARPL